MNRLADPDPVRPPDAYGSLRETATRLLRAFQLERGLVRSLGGWMAGVPYWDAKLAMGDHLWEHARSASALLGRLHELKESTAERQECAAISALLEVLMASPEADAFLGGLYQVLLPHITGVYRAWAESADPVMDPSSHRLLLEAAERLDEQAAWKANWRPAYSPDPGVVSSDWLEALATVCHHLDWERGVWLDGGEAITSAAQGRREFEGFAAPRRDVCFRTATVNEVARQAGDSFAERRRTIFYNHTQEMQFAESLGAILYDTPEMPWAFHHDLARHCSDEIRHTRMGCTRLEQLGEDLRSLPMLAQNYSLRSKLDPMERFCMMTLVIEAASFEKKRANVKMFADEGDRVSERYESYDIRDEMLHVNFGHTWVPIMLRVNQDARSVTELVQHCRDILDDALKDERREA